MTVADSGLWDSLQPASEEEARFVLHVSAGKKTGRSGKRGERFLQHVRARLDEDERLSERQKRVIEEMGTARNGEEVVRTHLGKLEAAEKEYGSVGDVRWVIAESAHYFWKRLATGETKPIMYSNLTGLVSALIQTSCISNQNLRGNRRMENIIRLLRDVDTKKKWNSMKDGEVMTEAIERLVPVLSYGRCEEIERSRVRERLEEFTASHDRLDAWESLSEEDKRRYSSIVLREIEPMDESLPATASEN